MELTHLCKDRESASEALADRLVALLADAIRTRGQASIVVSGGSSPVGLFRRLANASLDWSKVHVIPSDERLVPLDSSERNESMIRSTLMERSASAATLVSLVSDPDNEAATEAFANANVGQVATPFDAVVLGMGGDGHTASLFPDSANITDALESTKDCIIQHVPSQQRTRISLTPKALLHTRQLFLLLFGEDKQVMLDKALEPGPVEEYPVRVALRSAVPFNTYWAP